MLLHLYVHAIEMSPHPERALAAADALRTLGGPSYSEPRAWMQPVRHALGALLLERGRVDEAAAVYRADLGLDESAPRVARRPNNVWALQGYTECLDKLGQAEELARLLPKLDSAPAGADIKLSSSCFCRRQDSS
jgi:hypothetical protein